MDWCDMEDEAYRTHQKIKWWSSLGFDILGVDFDHFNDWFWSETRQYTSATIDAYIYEHYAEDLKRPEILARIIGANNE